MTAADDLNRATWEEAIVTYLKVLSWHLCWKAEAIRKILLSR